MKEHKVEHKEDHKKDHLEDHLEEHLKDHKEDRNRVHEHVETVAEPRMGRRHHGNPVVSFQWHLTAKCDQTCKHCYMHESESFQKELKGELSFDDCIRVIDDLYGTLKRWNALGGFAFTGGDPLLRSDLFDILKYVGTKSDVFTEILMMGNPFHLSLDVAEELKKHGVIHYQISVDGMEETHDSLRQKGSFKASWEGIRTIKKAGLSAGVMFTLSNLNKNELFDVMRMADEENVDRFAFDRVVPVGSGANLRDDLVDNDTLKELMKEYMHAKSTSHFKNRSGFKSNLFKILCHEQGLLSVPEDRETLAEGCLVGKSVCILADGRVLPCRRLPIDIGKLPEQSFRDVFVNSPLLNKFRDLNNFKKCSHCTLGPVCRGCPAVAFGVTGDPFAPDPNCWRKW